MAQAAFTATLTGIGFNEPTRTYLNAHGLSKVEDLLTLPLDEIDKLFKHMASQRPPRPTGAAAAADPEGIMFPYLSARNWKRWEHGLSIAFFVGKSPTPLYLLTRLLAGS
jgi:hypothetical protein